MTKKLEFPKDNKPYYIAYSWRRNGCQVLFFDSYKMKQEFGTEQIIIMNGRKLYQLNSAECEWEDSGAAGSTYISSRVNKNEPLTNYDTNVEGLKEHLTQYYGKDENNTLAPEKVTFNERYEWMKKNIDCEIAPPPQPPQPPTPGGGGEQNNGGQTNNPCSNTGQFGGGGKPLKDIKLFLYANKVTKGTIKLSKPQVEVGTYATDWRPNPADATKSIEMLLKQIESVKKGGRKSGKKRD